MSDVTLDELLSWLRKAAPHHETETCDCAVCFMYNAVIGTAKIIKDEKEGRQ